ncbi:hypothetical protein [Mycoplana ramosa]|uniref:Uncharacterized protein n=1 Tax=Mycoplana ramosa TaxID=40837 RepID=A0ABW3YWH6_MYCRA
MAVSLAHLSAEQRRVLLAAAADGTYRCSGEPEQAKARKLNSKGLLSRDPQDGFLWRPTDEGRRVAAELTGEASIGQGAEALPTVDAAPSLPAEAQRFDASDLAATVDRARQLLDDGDVMAARLLAAGAYDQAKAAGNFAARYGAAQRLVAKARQLQGDALLIETRAKIRIADEWDAAQADGRALKGRPKSISGENTFKQREAGLTAQDIHDARKLARAEQKSPGIVERAIEARLNAGLEPSRASVRHAIGTKTATKEEKGDQLYETPIEAVRTLLALESFSATVKEPAVGKGAILRPLEDAGYEVMIADLVDRGIATRHGELQQVGDFLLSVAGGSAGVDIVTNPPYAELANAFPAHALREHKPRKMALLLNWNFAAGFDDPNRVFVMDENPPSRIYLFTRRLPMMHREGWDGPKASSQMNTAWFVWERNDDGSYGDSYPRLIRVDWKDFETAPALAPGAGGNVAPMGFRSAPEEDEFARSTPRKTLEERVDEARAPGLIWIAEQDGFDAVSLRRGIGVRPSVAEALIGEFSSRGLIVPADDNQWRITAQALVAVTLTAAEIVMESEAA